VPINWRVTWRKAHRWGAALVAVPFLLVIVTGLLLQLKKQVAWVQPPAMKGRGTAPGVGLDAVLAAARSVPEAEIGDWADVERIDVQPGRGLAKVLSKNRWEVQVDLGTGAVLHAAYRRSDLIEALHDGSWFHDAAKVWVFLPSGAVVLGLWLTGAYLFVLPYVVRRRQRQRAKG
jgi:uncharacterized iron-regulated membrane protein